MTLATPQNKNPLQLIFQASSTQGLIPQGETLPAVPTLADLRRLRRLLPQAWPNVEPDKKAEMHGLAVQVLSEGPKPWQVLAGLPHAIPHTYRLIRTYGVKDAVARALALDAEMKGFLQDVLSIWENEQPQFQEALERAVREAATSEKTRVRTKEELRAVLDDLF